MFALSGHTKVDEPEKAMADKAQFEYEQLYRAHAHAVYAYCLRRTTTDEAKDAMADVFVVAWRRFEDMPKGDGALPWLYGVARNVLSDKQRSARRRDRLFVRAVSNFEASVPGPEAQIVRRSEHEDVISALGRLPEKDREIVLLVQWEGISREKVAEMMYLSRSAIDKRIAKAYERMAKSLGARIQDVRTPPVTIEEGGKA
jgi:RNA polymerase sigma-70 factor (ECF subfamily)